MMDSEIVSSQLRMPLQIMQVPHCPVCWENFDSNIHVPLLLNCGHTVCRSCLNCLPSEARLGQMCLRCPECRVPCVRRGMHGLHKNYVLLRALGASSHGSEGLSGLPTPVYGLLPEIHDIFNFRSILWVDNVSSQGLFREKIHALAKLSCIAGLVLLFTPLSVVHVLFAWWTAAIWFLIFLWLSVADLMVTTILRGGLK